MPCNCTSLGCSSQSELLRGLNLVSLGWGYARCTQHCPKSLKSWHVPGFTQHAAQGCESLNGHASQFAGNQRSHASGGNQHQCIWQTVSQACLSRRMTRINCIFAWDDVWKRLQRLLTRPFALNNSIQWQRNRRPARWSALAASRRSQDQGAL